MDNLVLPNKKTINCRGRLLNFEIPKVMGILNVTPDSFYDGGNYTTVENIQKRIDQLIEQEADIIDIGAYSSRPGSKLIGEEEELIRLKPALEYILKKYPGTITSIDTFRSGIATNAVRDYGVSIINDISAGELDAKMFDTVSSLQVPYIMMHMKGNPENMQHSPEYKNVIEEIFMYFSEKILILKTKGVPDIIIDPGFGFGKSILHNYQIINQLNEFGIFGLPLLAGLSRKSMIYNVLNCSKDDALNGTTVLNTIALMKGANILRVHDVPEAKQVISLCRECTEA